MSIRALILIIILVPAMIIGGAKAFGLTIPVPSLGRDYVVGLPLDGRDVALELPEIEGPDDPNRPLVVIDAGHGGRDPGSIGRTSGGEQVLEKEIVLALALALRDELLREGGVRIAMTRNDDRLVELAYRPEIARLLDADLFISIHADSGGERADVSGASVYTLSAQASSEAAARFAARENNADQVNGASVEGQSEEVSAILVELSQAQTQEDANEFSELIQREGKEALKFHPQASRSAELAVLRAPDVPGVLFESGFVTNQSDRIRLTTKEGQAQYARVLARAIRIFFARRAEP
ncbi:MAG: N-acetylmuramoyl-L-alanine amidase [Erythrobacter sp.]